MEDVTDEVRDADITVNIDTESHKVPPGLLQLGLGVTQLHENTKLRVQHVGLDSDDYPQSFRIEGQILTDY